MIRIRLRPAELARVRFADRSHPVGVAMLASQALRAPGATATTPAVARRLERAAVALRPLLHLLPASGPLPDFLTPLAGIESLDAGLSVVRATPAERIRTEVARLYTHTRPTALRRRFAAADPEVLDALVGSVRRFFDDVLAPMWPAVQSAYADEVADGGRRLALSGVDGLLDGMHPRVRWRSPVLEVDPVGDGADVDVAARGVMLYPSPFAGPHPRVLVEPGRSVLVVYPSGSPASLAARPPGGDPLAELMGRTRAAVLRAVTGPGRHTTSAVARVVGVSVSSGSEHLAALRAARLVASRRDGGAVVHRLTALGSDLVRVSPS